MNWADEAERLKREDKRASDLCYAFGVAKRQIQDACRRGDADGAWASAVDLAVMSIRNRKEIAKIAIPEAT